MAKELLLTIDVECKPAYRVSGQIRDIVMIPFTGRASGEKFNGTIAEGGVDTQKMGKGEEAFLSARYLLRGKDCAGNDCQVFVENEGRFSEGFRPTIVTDTPVLADWETAVLSAEVKPIPGGVQVSIFR
ncbi:MAG: DUF3237 family protein [Clostridia bacterium]|nr:DUF3237 family protein [Clostridia bacterium]MBQ9252157.1 DUF3237 family protein [Clostridia bacterium]